MKIYISPVRTDEQVVASVSGDILTINSQVLDFSPLLEGESLPSEAVDTEWLQGNITRIDGEIHLTLLLPHGANAPYETRFPTAFETPITVLEGEVPLPPYDSEVQGGQS